MFTSAMESLASAPRVYPHRTWRRTVLLRPRPLTRVDMSEWGRST
jgi:hypothetical protein